MNRSYLTSVGFAATSIALFAPSIAHAQAPDLASVTAKTVQVTTEQWNVPPVKKGEEPKPIQLISTARVSYDRTGKANITEVSRANAPANYKHSMIVADGTSIYELVGSIGQYFKGDAPASGAAIRSRTGLVASGLGVALGWKGNSTEKFAPAADETVDGKTLKVYTQDRTITGKLPSGEEKTVTYLYKLWVDPATKLPARYSFSVKDGDKITAVSRTDFKDWKLDAPIDATQLAWNPPAGVTEYQPPKLLAEGVAAPDFTVPKWGGGNLKLSDYKGKVVILDFWATWCGPCQLSMPHVEQVYQKTKAMNVAVLGVCVWDEKDAYDKWVPTHKEQYNFTFGFDPAGRGADSLAGKQYGVSGIPTTYVIDKDGKVAATIVGYDKGDKRLEDALAKLGVAVPAETAQAK